ncbi:hypothetical protein ACFPRL_15290 [Pseudoclavibacter helvolus]
MRLAPTREASSSSGTTARGEASPTGWTRASARTTSSPHCSPWPNAMR